MVVVVVALVLGGLTNDCADPGAGCSADQGSFEPAAEDCAEGRATGAANEGAFAGADATLAMIVVVIIMVVVVVVRVAVVVVVPAACAVTHAVVVGAVVVVVVLRGGGKDTGREQERSKENRFSELVHPRLDAGWRLREIFRNPYFSVFCGKVFSVAWISRGNSGLRRGVGPV
jgi:Flp pilus assembly protein TadB